MDITYIVFVLLLLPFLTKSLEFTKIYQNEIAKDYQRRIAKLWFGYVLMLSFLFFSIGEIYNVFPSLNDAVILSLGFFGIWIFVIAFVYFLSFKRIIRILVSHKNKNNYNLSIIPDVIFSLFVLAGMTYGLLYTGIGLFFGYKITNLSEFIINLPSLLSMILIPILIFPYLELWINGKKLREEASGDA